ncbi:MAG TPA: FxLYD domain-containing protein [Candidatus Fimivivens sp.]|nr:FxLYD domain-containing protein [Candidatus Fimivivens sp.]
MTNSQRSMKRLRITSVVILFLVAVGAVAYYLFRPAQTCIDGRRNQNETGVDCGGVCGPCTDVLDPDPFVVREAAFVSGNGSGIYDVFVKVHNPNDTIGAAQVRYDIVLKDTSGSEVGRIPGVDSLLPQETRLLVAVGAHVTGIPASVEVSFRDATWQRFSGYQERPQLTVYRTRFDKLSSGPYFGQVFGTLRNESSYDFRSVTVKMVLRDASGTPVALNQTEINTVLAGDNRDFTLIFPKAFPGDVASVEAETDADFFHQDNFIKRYRSGNEQFQKLQ